jgi:hypothetical protein
MRFWSLSAPLYDPHPRRQMQTALTVLHLFKGDVGFLDYSSPYGGRLWNMVYEFPFYQWLAAQLMRSGLPLETASRLVSVFFSFLAVYFVYRLALMIFGSHAARWVALLYFIAPFDVIYARTCLIDTAAIAFELGSIFFLLTAIEGGNRPVARFAAATGFGCLAGMIKVTSWFSPALFLGCYLLFRRYRKSLARGVFPAAAASLAAQLFFATAWTLWSNHVRWHQTALLGGEIDSWIIGPLALRFSSESWQRLLLFFSRWLMHDWMLAPFVAGCLLADRKPGWRAACIGISLTAVLVVFHVHVAHEYYFIAEAPYLFALAGVGLAWLVENRRYRVPQVLLLLTLSLFALRLAKTSLTYSAMRWSPTGWVTAYRRLAAVTDPRELVYADGHFDTWEWPLFADRLVVLGSRIEDPSLAPTVFHFDQNPQAGLLAAHPKVWIDGDRIDFPVYRVQAVGPFAFDPQRHLAVFTEKPATARGGNEFDACAEGLDVAVRAATGIQVEVRESGRKIRLPWRPYLHLPSRSAWGCHFRVSE